MHLRVVCSHVSNNRTLAVPLQNCANKIIISVSPKTTGCIIWERVVFQKGPYIRQFQLIRNRCSSAKYTYKLL